MSPNPPIIAVAGKPRHGKSTTATLLSAITGLPWGDTSSLIYQEVAKDEGVSTAELRKQPKNVIRPKLIAKGDELCSEDPAFLLKHLVNNGVSILSGLRKLPELAALRLHFPTRRVIVVWVEALQEPVLKALAAAGHTNLYHAPDITDNTDTNLRNEADEIIYNHSMVFLDVSVRIIAAKLTCHNPLPQQ